MMASNAAGRSLRTLLLASVAGLASAAFGARDARATCSTVLDTTTCDGGTYGGITAPGPFLVVDGATNGPVLVNTPGISMVSGSADASIETRGPVTVTSDAFGMLLLVTGSFAGTITLSPDTEVTAGGFGALVQTDSGAASLTVNGGSIATTGNAAIGAGARSVSGQASVTLAAGAAVQTQGANSHGGAAFSLIGSATITSGGDVTTHGDDAIGLQAQAVAGAAASITITGGTIATGDTTLGTGINAYGAQASGGTASIVMTGGSIETHGFSAHGLYALSGAGPATITAAGTIETAGTGAAGLLAVSGTGPTSITAAAASPPPASSPMAPRR